MMKAKYTRAGQGYRGSISHAIASIPGHGSLSHDSQALQKLAAKIAQSSITSKSKLSALDADLSDPFMQGLRELNARSKSREKAMTFEDALTYMKAGQTIESGEGGQRIKLQMPWNETAQRYDLRAWLIGINNRLWAPLHGVGADLLSRTDWKIAE